MEHNDFDFDSILNNFMGPGDNLVPAETEERTENPEPEYQEPVYEEPAYEEPTYEEPVYEEPEYRKSGRTSPESGEFILNESDVPQRKRRRNPEPEPEDDVNGDEPPRRRRRAEQRPSGKDAGRSGGRNAGQARSGKDDRDAKRDTNRNAKREARAEERREERRRRIMEDRADRRRIEEQKLAAVRERDESREFYEQERIAARKRDVEGRRKSKIGLVAFIAVIALIVTGFVFAAKAVYNSPTSLPNLYAGTVKIGNMTDVEIDMQLAEVGWDNRASTVLTVTLPAGVSITVDPVTAGMILPASDIRQKALSYGRTGNMFTTMFNYIECLFKPLDLNDASTTLNTEYIQQQISTAQQLVTEAVGTEPCTIDYEAGQLRAVKGAGELELETVGLMNGIVAALKAGTSTLDYRVATHEPAMPDFNAIHDQIAAEMVDAKYSDDGKFEVIDETVGCDFSVDEAVSIWNSTAIGETAVIPMQVTLPNVTGEELRSRLYCDILGEMTTYFPNSTDDRVNNVALCSSKVNGTVLYSGDVFSYNATVGERTEEAGFKYAAAYSGGEVVEELGGGACQVSSTIYCATLYACMETVERTCHQFEVAYMDQLGLDATVSWPEPDFKFRNNKEYPIRIDIECDTEARSLHVKIMGTKENDYTVELKTDKYRYTLEDGTQVGWRTLTYRYLYDSDGNIVQVPDEYGNMVDFEYTNAIIEATGRPGMDTYMFH